MRHARPDYNRIQDPALQDPSLLAEGTTPFGEDEPVFLLRARDRTAPAALRFWAGMQPPQSGSARVARAWAEEMERWQALNGCKTADLPGEPPMHAQTIYPAGLDDPQPYVPLLERRST